MDLGLKGKSAIVCASSRGLGRACAMSLARAGCEVIINGRDQEALAATAEVISSETASKVIPIIADVGTPDGRAALLDACPNPDILINNNGGPPLKDFREISTEAMLDGVNQNMVTPIELVKAVIDGMIERKFGRIVNITSSSVYAPIAGLDLSSGARAGLTAFLSGVARTVAQHNVTINNILPGRFETDRLTGNLSTSAAKQNVSVEELAERQKNQIPARRFGQPEEFGDACAFLCAQQAGYITGQNLLLDGGMIAVAF